ncbi:ParB N-terminal domain-containing protein [Kineosporia rhizophila]|uniref:ParB/RepB/Spo0J family partition protein n=1 Tax=Kineosporia rhizophila TaxID=84633 RepID=UPI001E5B1525|nr:ParB N-terminal domain-containing protein [Kineosporia rhizophila]MCE0537490.1 ParB N-terminal domain-containing protein [Kineosporia rhizophila]
MPLNVASTDISVADSGLGNPVFDSAEAIERLPVQTFPLSRLEPGRPVRGIGTDQAHVQLLAEVAGGTELPPLLVQRNGSRIVDGMHRYAAARLRGQAEIRVRVVDCSDEEAFILAVRANTWHGLPLSRTDRMAGARQIVTWHPDWSDRSIGVATGLSAKTIAGIRRRMCDSSTPQEGKRLGRDGKRRPLTAAEGRRRAAEYILARPDASLREIAREADVAPATAQDVRARIRRGVDPIATGRAAAAERAAEGNGVNPTTGRPGRPGLPGRRPAPSMTPAMPAAPGAPAGLRAGRQPSWPALSPKLANDPALKYTDNGRAFMSWMVMHVINSGEWRDFVETVPPHWLGALSTVADKAGQEWIEFAEELRRRRSGMEYTPGIGSGS